MLNIEPQIEKDSFTIIQDNTINEMVQTNSHRFNTHVKRLSLSAPVVIIIITRLLATSRLITQYFNHLLLYNFTTSPLKIGEPSSTSNYDIHGFDIWKLILIPNSWLFEYAFQVILSKWGETSALQGGKRCN